MDATLILLAIAVVLHSGHTGIHVLTTFVWRRPDLPEYDAWVGYMGALVWWIMILENRGTLDLPVLLAVPAGFALVASGLYIHFRGVRDLRAYRDDGELVTQGIYARLRHPIYYGWVPVCIGFPLITLSWYGLVTAPLWAILLVVCGPMEERDMRRRLPEGVYESYASSTWF